MKFSPIIKVRKNLKKGEELRQMVEKCANYLKPGRYHIEYFAKKAILKAGDYEKLDAKSIYKRLVFGKFQIQNPNPAVQCTIATCSPFENYKLFDKEALKTYTLFSDLYWKNFESFYEVMSPYFRTEIDVVDRSKHVLIENYVAEAIKVKPQVCFDYFCGEYRKYLLSYRNINKTVSVAAIKIALDSVRLERDVREYVDYIENRIIDFDVQYPVMVCHNDVDLDNILTVDNCDFSLIDFELCGENVFFFDFLGLIFNSAVFKEDHSLFKEYLAGALDESIENLFQIYDLEYKAFDRNYYLFVFLLFRIYMVYEKYPEHLSTYTKRIWKFFELYGL